MDPIELQHLKIFGFFESLAGFSFQIYNVDPIELVHCDPARAEFNVLDHHQKHILS